jgi:hypothetical protein
VEKIKSSEINQYELADWLYKQVMKRVNNDIKQQRDELESYRIKLQDKYEQISESLRQIKAYAESQRLYVESKEKTFKDHDKSIADRHGNLQRIYDKMLEIEKRLGKGEWPGILPPIELNLNDQ